ncbi:hypothetical protein [Aestuariivirga sp.]|uniref:hypothetical protein n=1 Tax=Aestuariivirga sp. TaxID=2650926 RepID=UPI0039E49065
MNSSLYLLILFTIFIILIIYQLTYLALINDCTKSIKDNELIINLSGKGCGINGAIAIGEHIKKNPALISLNMYRNKIKDDGVIALANALKNNNKLTSLSLDYNQITNIGAKAIADALIINKSLKTLSLFDNLIKKDGAIALALSLKQNNILTSLNLFRNQIGNDGALALADCLLINKALIKLEINGNQVRKDILQLINERLEENKKIATISNNVYQTGILDLTIKKMDTNDIDNIKELLHFAKIIKIKNIGDAGTALLINHLRNINNNNNNQNLQQIIMDNNQLTDIGIHMLNRILKIHKGLKVINLRNNFITDNGIINLLEGLYNDTNSSSRCQLNVLDLRNNKIGNIGGEIILNILKKRKSTNQLSRVMISGNSISNQIQSEISSILNEGLILQTIKELTNNNNKEMVINLSESETQDNDLKKLSEYLKNVETIRLSNTKITDEGILIIKNGLKSSTKIRELDLSDNIGISSKSFPILLELCEETTIIDINIANTKINKEFDIVLKRAIDNRLNKQQQKKDTAFEENIQSYETTINSEEL